MKISKNSIANGYLGSGFSILHKICLQFIFDIIDLSIHIYLIFISKYDFFVTTSHYINLKAKSGNNEFLKLNY